MTVAYSNSLNDIPFSNSRQEMIVSHGALYDIWTWHLKTGREQGFYQIEDSWRSEYGHTRKRLISYSVTSFSICTWQETRISQTWGQLEVDSIWFDPFASCTSTTQHFIKWRAPLTQQTNFQAMLHRVSFVHGSTGRKGTQTPSPTTFTCKKWDCPFLPPGEWSDPLFSIYMLRISH